VNDNSLQLYSKEFWLFPSSLGKRLITVVQATHKATSGGAVCLDVRRNDEEDAQQRLFMERPSVDYAQLADW